jgi:hypothetical protein
METTNETTNDIETTNETTYDMETTNETTVFTARAYAPRPDTMSGKRVRTVVLH